MAGRGRANWEVGWEALGGGASWAKTSQAGSAEGPGPAVGVSLLKARRGQRSAEQRPSRSHAGSQAAHSEVTTAPPPSIPARPGGGHKTRAKLQRDRRTHTHTVLERNEQDGKKLHPARSPLRWNELD